MRVKEQRLTIRDQRIFFLIEQLQRMPYLQVKITICGCIDQGLLIRSEPFGDGPVLFQAVAKLDMNRPIIGCRRQIG